MGQDVLGVHLIRWSVAGLGPIKNKVSIEVGDRSMLRIGGVNGSGKTSLFDGIRLVLLGERIDPREIIHHGKRRAEVDVDTDCFYAKREWWSEGDGTVRTDSSIVSKMGAKLGKRDLSRLLSPTLFSPRKFADLPNSTEGRRQLTDMIRASLALDFSDLDQQIANVRQLAKRLREQKEQAEGERKSLSWPEDTPEKTVDIKALLETQRQIRSRNQLADSVKGIEEDLVGLEKREAGRSELDAAWRLVNDSVAEVDRLREELREAEDRLARARGRAAELKQVVPDVVAVTDMRTVLENTREMLATADATLGPNPPAEEEIEVQIGSAEEVNIAVRARARAADLDVKIREFDKGIKDARNQVGGFENDKGARLQENSRGIEGLDVDQFGLRYLGAPIEQASTAQRLALGCEIAAVAGGDLRICFLEEAALFDDEMMALVEQRARERNFLVLAEVATRTIEGDDRTEWVLSDGELVKAPPEGVSA